VKLFPLFLQLEGRRVLVVGGGTVGERKVEELLEAGAQVHLVSPTATPRLRELAAGRIEWSERQFDTNDASNVWFVVAATNDKTVNERIASAAETVRVFVNAVDDIPNASAFLGSVLRRAPFIISLSSSGELPGLTRLLREILERALPEESFVTRARELRRKWKHEGTPHASRFSELLRAAFDHAGN
jgi:uroporphyrin-III C-methyltransferase/precorrin-2 dehydrogenase/sirohydrochlorin ferrochelatase